MTARKHHLHRLHLTAPTGRVSESRTLRRLASGVVILTIGLAAISLVTANNLATQGKASQDLDQKISTLQSENNSLTAENAQLTAVTKIYAQALAAGFVSPKKLQNLTRTPVVALLNP